MLYTILFICWLGLKYSFLLWVYFLAVMKLRDVKVAGKLVGVIRYPAFLVLGIGYGLDAAVNVFPVSLILWEIPQWRGIGASSKPEWTVSDRTKRWAQTDTRRGAISRFLRSKFLAVADSSGGHD